MKKIGIITIYDMVNYGNRLQNYAVYQILSKHGVKAETVVCELPINPFVACKRYFLSMIHALNLPKYPIPDPGYIRYCRFEKFTRKWIPTRKIYDSRKVLSPEVGNQYDAFIAGSDQIWNYEFPGRFGDFKIHSKDYFLTFVPPQKRFSISASFGITQIPSEWLPFYTQELQKFQCISVRERHAVEMVKELTGNKAVLLSDPVMALSVEEWDQVAHKPKRIDTSKPYLLTYFLSPPSAEIEKKVHELADTLGCRIYRLWDISAPNIFLSDPSEFLYLIKHARFVCTDSFHATAFSIIYERPFATVKRGNMNSRIETLLDTFGLRERMIEKLDIQNPLLLDYHFTRKVLHEKQVEFHQYIEMIVSMI